MSVVKAKFLPLSLRDRLRREEALGLKWSNVDFENDIILIAHTVTEARKDGHKKLSKYEADTADAGT